MVCRFSCSSTGVEGTCVVDAAAEGCNRRSHVLQSCGNDAAGGEEAGVWVDETIGDGEDCGGGVSDITSKKGDPYFSRNHQ